MENKQTDVNNYVWLDFKGPNQISTMCRVQVSMDTKNYLTYTSQNMVITLRLLTHYVFIVKAWLPNYQSNSWQLTKYYHLANYLSIADRDFVMMDAGGLL